MKKGYIQNHLHIHGSVTTGKSRYSWPFGWFFMRYRYRYTIYFHGSYMGYIYIYIWVVEIEIPRFFWFGLRVFSYPWRMDPWPRVYKKRPEIKKHFEQRIWGWLFWSQNFLSNYGNWPIFFERKEWNGGRILSQFSQLHLYNFAFAKPIPRRFDFYLSFLRGKDIGIYETTHIYALS